MRVRVRGGLIRGGVRAPRRRPCCPSRRLGAGHAAAAVVDQLARAGDVRGGPRRLRVRSRAVARDKLFIFGWQSECALLCAILA